MVKIWEIPGNMWKTMRFCGNMASIGVKAIKSNHLDCHGIGRRLTCAHKIYSGAHTGFWLTCAHKSVSVVHTEPSGDGVGLVNVIIFLAVQQTQALLFHDQLLVSWGGVRWGNNVHVPVHTQAQQPYHLSCCPSLYIGTQPLLHFLRRTITLQPWGVGRG